MRARPNTLLPAVILAVAIILPWAPVPQANSAGADGVPGFLIPVEGNGTLISADHDGSVVRARTVRVDLAQLGELGDTVASSTFRDRLPLNLFDDTVFTAVLDRAEPNATGGGYTWIGNVESKPYSLAILAVRNGRMLGTISTLEESYVIEPAEGDLYLVKQIDAAALAQPEQNDALRPPEDPAAAAGPGNPTAGATTDGEAIIDVMFAYTPALRDGMGGSANVLLGIDGAVAYANTAFANSGIAARLQLVKTVEVAYTESGSLETDLERVTGTSDGYMEEVHAARDSVRADLVVLLVAPSDPNAGGIAWLLSGLSPNKGRYGFSVSEFAAEEGRYATVAHEIGHNMGAHHDWYVEDGPGLYTYSHGYTNVAAGWTTIMAYYSECFAHNKWCPHIPYFSNPDVSSNGAPTGVPAGTNTSCTPGDINHPACDADNALTLDNSASLVANYRVPLPVLSASLSHSPTPVVASTSRIHYAITLRNSGEGAATGVQVAHTIPAETTYVDDSASHGGYQYSWDTIVWTGLSLEPKGSLTLSLDLDVTAPLQSGQVLAHAVEVSSNEGVGFGPAQTLTIVDPRLLFLPVMPRSATAR